METSVQIWLVITECTMQQGVKDGYCYIETTVLGLVSHTIQCKGQFSKKIDMYSYKSMLQSHGIFEICFYKTFTFIHERNRYHALYQNR
jgi:hypothetical protein